MKKVVKVILFGVIFSKTEVTSEPPIYFENEDDANKVAALPLGWYGGRGYVSEKEFKENELPKFYKTIGEYKDDCLTPNQAKKFGI